LSFLVFLIMFLRKKTNISGLVSIQVLHKQHGKSKLLKTIGSAREESVINNLLEKGNAWIRQQQKQADFDFSQEDKLLEVFIDGIEAIKIAGIELMLGKLFDEIGFNKVDDQLFRKLVLARVCFPASKLKTTEYLRRYEGYQTDEDKIYRYLDKLSKKQKREVQQISYDHTLSILNGQINVVFYDVTTLYFEIEQEDELRKTGFSKDGKHQNPQIVLGLLVSTDGYPLGYDIFKGNKFEGQTMMPVLNFFRRKYKIKNLVVVADAGLLSNKNIEALEANKYEYILGAKIKNESNEIKDQILALHLANGQTTMVPYKESRQLIISYSEARAKKDAANRIRGVEKLKKNIQSGKLTKKQINNKGYNKFLQIKGTVDIAIDESRIESDKKWDGLKGYITNTTLDKEVAITQYNQLWQIEKAFRIAKTDIKIRPIYHRLPRRIEAHVCIAFTAYKIYKELNRQLKLNQSDLSPEKAIEIAKTIYLVEARKPISKELYRKVIIKSQEQAQIAKMFNF
jgi:transposase